jgi:hypothetical protein
MTGAAAAALACAIEMLGNSAGALPPIKLLALPPPGVSSRADGFVREGEPIIYVLTSSTAFRNAECHNPPSLFKLASVLAHEAWHIRHGGDERGAYEAQLKSLLWLGATRDSQVYRGVLRSMQVILQERDRADARARRAAAETKAEIAVADGRAP